jgi:hypothetical protein
LLAVRVPARRAIHPLFEDGHPLVSVSQRLVFMSLQIQFIILKILDVPASLAPEIQRTWRSKHNPAAIS